MPERGFLGDRYSAGPAGSGIDASAVLANGTLPTGIYPDGMIDDDALFASDLDEAAKTAIRAKLGITSAPANRLLPDPSGLTSSDNGDITLYEDGSGWQRGGFANGNQIKVRYDAAANNLVPDWQETRHQQEVFDSFTDGGWQTTADAEVSTAIKLGATPHTLAELQALTYAATRTNPSPNTDQAYIGVRVALARNAEAEEGKFRIAQLGDGETVVALSADLSDDTHIGDDATWAYHSVSFIRFVSDEVTRAEELDPFELDRRYIDPLLDHERQVIEGFERSAWDDAAADAMALTQPSSLPFNASIQSVAFAAVQTVTAQANPFHIGIRLPLARKGDVSRYRIEVTEGATITYRALAASDHVSDTATHAYFQVRFPSTTATRTMQAQQLDDHRIDPDLIRIDWTDLRNTPAALVANRFPRVNGSASAIELIELGGTTPAAATTDGAEGDDEVPARRDHSHPAQTIANTSTDADLRAESTQVRTVSVPLANSWYTGAAYLIEAGKFYYFEWLPGGNADNAAELVAGDTLLRLSAQEVGGTGRTRDNSWPIGNLDIGRNLNQELVWSSGEAQVTGTLRISKLESTGILDPTAVPAAQSYTMPSDVQISIPATADTWGTWQDIATPLVNSSSITRHYWFGVDLNPKASWVADGGGDRAASDTRIQIVDASDVVQSTPISHGFTYIRNGPSDYDQVTEHGNFDVTIPIDLPAGHKVRLQGRGIAQQLQTAGTDPGQRYVDLDADEQIFFWREETALQGASARQVQAISRPNETRFVFQRRSDTAVPTLGGIGFDGVAYTNLGSWVLDRPPGGTGVLWMGSIFRWYAQGGTPPWQVTPGGVFPAGDTVYSTTPQGVPLQLTYDDGSDGRGNRSLYVSHLGTDGHFGPFLPLVGSTDLVHLFHTSWRLSARSNTKVVPFLFTGLDILEWEFFMAVGVSGPDASTLNYTKQFYFRPEGGPQAAAVGSTARSINDTWRVSMKNDYGTGQSTADISASDTAPPTRGAGVRQEMGFDMKFRRVGTDSSRQISEAYFFNPESWATDILGNRTIVSVDLWARRNPLAVVR